jgi:hypothetical protein
MHRPPKDCMPKLADLFLRFKVKVQIFVDGSIEAVLSVYAVPIKLKYSMVVRTRPSSGRMRHRGKLRRRAS